MAADGHIKIAVEVDGKQVKATSEEFDKLGAAGKKSGKGVKETEDGLKGVGNESKKASSNVKKFATALGLVAIGAAAFKTLKASMDDAISRFDTLNKFPKVLQALGVSAEDSEKAMSRLSDGIDGLPTKLDEISSTAQRMYTSFNDMDKATDTALALNNALLGSGSSAENAQRGTEQYLQALQRGKFEMEEWKTLQETMDIGLIKVAESFGYTGKTAKQDLYAALKDGIITMEQFNDKLIEVGTGTGVMASLAKENSLGIATSLGNLKNAAARGMADIIASFNKLSKEVTGKDIAQNIDSLKAIVNQSFKVMGSVIEGATPIVKAFASGVKATIPIVKTLSPALIGLMTAYGAYIVITKATAAVQASNAILKVATASKTGLTLVTKAHTVALATDLKMTQSQTTAMIAQTGAVRLSHIATGLLTGQLGLLTAVKTVATAATYAFGAAIKFLMGPVGWVTAGIGLLVTGVIAVIKWFKKNTAEAERLNKETEELGGSVESLNDELKGSSDAYKKNQSEIKATSKANKDLAKRIDELSKKENKSAAEKKLLNDYVDQLNDSVEGLNLSYSEESDALNMSSKELQARIDLMGEQTSYNAALERQVEIAKEQAEVDQKLEETNKLRDEWNQKLDEGSVKSREHKKALEELDEQEQLLNETTALLAEEQKATEEQITASIGAISEATKQGVATQKLSYEELSDAQKQTVDNMKETWLEYKEAATDMFETLSDEAELTVSEMTSNLEENQRIIGNWAEGIATLAERGVDEGLLDTLREAGPESAGHVNALVNASDEELKRLSEVFANGGDIATDALSKSLGIDESGVMDAIGDLVTNTEQSLRQQVKSANFDSIGIDVANGYAGGMEEGTPKAEKAAKDMADKTTKATKDALEVKSPSKVFEEIGTNVAEGLELGISDGTAKIIEVMETLATSMIEQFDDIKTDFKSIGKDAMSGLNQGLNEGKTQVLSTARSIANSVASTMKNALKIKSPSKVMEDDVGRWVPEGLALGIKDNANSVYRELDKLSGAMMLMSSPEMALGTSRMAYSGAGYFVGGGFGSAGSSSQNSNTASGSVYEFNFEIPMDGETVAKKTARYTARELESMRKDEARGRGYR